MPGYGAASESEYVSQRYGAADPDPCQNVTDPQHWRRVQDPYSLVPSSALIMEDTWLRKI